MGKIGAKIVEVGSTAGGIARVDYKTEGGTTVFGFDDTTQEAAGTAVSTTGAAGKLLKFSSVANTLLHFFRIRKSSTGALNVQDDNSVDVFNVDTVNRTVSTNGSMASTMSNATKTKNLTLTNSNLNGETSIIFRQDVGHDLAEISQIRNGYDGRLRFKVSDASGELNTCLDIRGSGKAVIIPSLAGTGNRAVYSDAAGVLTNTSSDERVKKNIKNITDEMNVLNVLKNIRGVTYNWDTEKEGYEGAGEQQEIGVIAQEIEQYIPQVVGENSTGYKSVDYAKLIAYLIEVNKALLEKIELLESKVV